MIRYRIAMPGERFVEISLDASGPDEHGTLRFEGLGFDVRNIEERMYSSHGINGHLINEETTPVDLDIALRGRLFVGFERELVEGQDILDRYERKLRR